MKEIIFNTDRNLCLRSWGEGIAEMTGTSPADLSGKKYYEIFPRIYIGEKDALSETVKNKKTMSLKGHLFHCFFSRIQADVTIKPVKSSNGNVDEVEVTICPQSTCSIAKKLHESQRLIDIGKVASSLAHGVRNPLNAIKGAVVYLREKYAHEGPLIEFTKIMEEEVSRLEHFISRFLSSSISNAECAETDLNALLKKIEVFTALQMRAGNITPTFEFGDVPPVTVNAFHLEQAVLNVVNNAIEAMKAGGGRLAVKTFRENRKGADFVVIAVSDSGPGMEVSRIDGLNGDKAQGKGFGLFITYEILKYYNGHMEIESKKNKGTTVRLYLPCNNSLGGRS